MMASASSNAQRTLSGHKKNQWSHMHDFHAEYEAGTSAEKGNRKGKGKAAAETSGMRKGRKRTRADVDDHNPPILGKNFNVIHFQEPSVLPKTFNVQVQMYLSLVCSLLNHVYYLALMDISRKSIVWSGTLSVTTKHKASNLSSLFNLVTVSMRGL